MSMESAKAFFERMNTDAEFAKRAIQFRDKEQIAAFLVQEGFDFSEAEYNRFCAIQEGRELSDESLDKVAGGFGGCYAHEGRPTIDSWRKK